MAILSGIDGRPLAGTVDIIFETSETKQFELGQKIVTSEGAVYKYAKNGAVALDNSVLTQSALGVANHMNQTCTATPAGSTSVTLTLGATAATKNQYADGYLAINDAGAATTTEGFQYRIKSHEAIGSAAAGVIELYDPIQVALTTASQYTLRPHKLNGLLITPVTTPTGPACGVTIADSVAIGYYCWIQTWGPKYCLINGTPAIGTAVCVGVTTAGTFDVKATDGQLPSLGVITETGVSTEYKQVCLQIDC